MVINLIGFVILGITVTLAWVWFSWKLSLLLFLALLGNNFERYKRNH